MSIADWKRPENVPFPSTWSKFEGKKEVNGRKSQYWIQDVDESLKKQVIHYMATEFTRDEPLCKYSGFQMDPVSKKEAFELWNEAISHNLALVCLTKNDEGETEIAAINATCRAYKNEPSPNFEGKCLQLLLGAIDTVSKMRNVYEELGVDHYLTGLGLYVRPKYRGDGLGYELLLARASLCKAVGIKVSTTSFTSIFSQRLAVKAGFKDMVDITYEELEKRYPKYSFPGIEEHTKSLRFMYIVYF